MALEDWCFAELKRGRSLDVLIQEIVEGNECIAILGVAVALALDTDAISEAVFPLVTSQALWSADHNRMAQDISANTTSLMGFKARTDQAHIDAIRSVNERTARKKQLRWLVPRYVFGGEQFAERTRTAIRNFKNALPYRYEEEQNDPAARENYLAQALEYEELADPENYEAYCASEDPDTIWLNHVSPSAAAPERQVKAEKATLYLRKAQLWTWAAKTFEDGKVADGFTTHEAIALAKQIDNPALFEAPEGEDDQIEMHRGAVAATAAVALNLREQLDPADLDWAREILNRAIRAPEERDAYWTSRSIIPWHPSIFVARGLAADLRNGTAEKDAATKLLALVAHPLEVVSLAALQEVSGLWSIDPKLAWSALVLAFSLCHIKRVPPGEMRGPGDPVHSQEDAQAALNHAAEFYLNGAGWLPIPQPPPAWVKLDARNARGRRQHYEDYDDSDAADPNEVWSEPDVYWYSQYAAKIIRHGPIEGIVASDAKPFFLDFMSSVLTWTNEKNAPPWVKPGRRDRSSSNLFEWIHELGETLGRIAGLLPLADIKPRLLEPILQLESDNCWALLAPFASSYVCRYIYDAAAVPSDAIEVLELCLERLLASSAIEKESYRSGEFSGFDQPRLVQTLMFVEIERANGAARYVNGDWSEIARILPIIDRFVRAGGWAAPVMDHYLTLCERAKASYPADAFADQVLAVIGGGLQSLKGWRGTFLSARIAQLVQDFAGRDASMSLSLAQKLLRILDLLVDMGDRRSAALQLGESFREIRLPS
ncbi:hypothetical protein [Microvirga vignae]|uniref:hypothetical protein n=1 Tax=Microvirga vignae TaxID=1225564 RepID=UPI000A5FA75C|nr:hypothetical protein [Microvirga vignae]